MTDPNLINDKCNLVTETTEQITDENGNVKIIVKQIYKEYSTYTPAHKKANKKYVENNKEKIVKYKSEYNRQKYKEDPEFRKKSIEAVQRYRLKKKMEKVIS